MSRVIILHTCTVCGRFVRTVFGQAVCKCPNGPTLEDRK